MFSIRKAKEKIEQSNGARFHERRVVNLSDADSIRRLVQETGVFSHEEVEVAGELAEEAILKGEEKSGYSFVFIEEADEVLGYSCFGPIPLTQSSYDLYWIAVDRNSRQKGIAKRLLELSEEAIKISGGTLLYAETSSRKDYAPAHAFYRKSGFKQCARQKKFYAPGDDKITFVKTI